MSTLVSLEYLAGFFDADGYVGVVKGKSGYYNLRCTITNIDKLTLQKFQSEYGGLLQSKSLSNPKWSHQFTLVWNGEKAKDLLNLIKNYSITKKNQIELALTFPIGKHNMDNEKNRINLELRKMKQVRKEL